MILNRLPSRFIENHEYAYAVGRVRALETTLIDRQKMERLAKCSLEEAGRILVDTDYSGNVSLLLNPQRFEEVLEQEKRRVFSLIDELIPDEKVRAFLHVEYDFFNVRVLLKGKIFERGVKGLLSDYGNIPVDEMESILVEEEYEKLPSYLREAVQNTIIVYYDSKDIRDIDISMDKAFIGYMNTKGFPPFLQDYYRLLTDLVNFRTLLRWKLLKEEKRTLEKILLPDGFIPAGMFLDICGDSLEQLPQHFSRWIYFYVFNEGIRYLSTRNSFLKLEQLMGKFLSDYVDTTRFIVFGVEPVIGYFLKKMKEIRNLRMILVGKFNRISEEVIMERIVL